MFRFIEASGRDQCDEDSDATHGDANSARAAAVAAAVALALLDSKRKNVMISYAAIEALITLAREHSTLADIKYIGASASRCCNACVGVSSRAFHSHNR